MKYEDFARHYDQIFPFNSQQCSFIGEYVNSNSQVLELGCGTGTIAADIAKKAGSIIGIDNDKAMVDIARTRCPDLDFRVMDILEIGDLPGKYDLIYSTGNVLSYIDEDSYSRLCSLIYDKLSSGGLWLFQVVNWDYFNKTDSYQFPVKSCGDMQFKRSYQFNSNNSQVIFSLELAVNETEGYKDTHLLYSRKCQRYIDITASAGLNKLGCWLDWSKTPWSPSQNGGIIQLWQKDSAK